MAPAVFCSDAYVKRLRESGSLRIRITDRKLVAGEKARIVSVARDLGRQAVMSYRHPYLYAVVGDKLSKSPDVLPRGAGRPGMDAGTLTLRDGPFWVQREPRP